MDEVLAWLDGGGHVHIERSEIGWIAQCSRVTADGSEPQPSIILADEDVAVLRSQRDRYPETLSIEAAAVPALPEWFWMMFAPRRCPRCSESLERDTMLQTYDERGMRLECPHCHGPLRFNLRLQAE
jgi:hypothetical protein